jgi:Zn-dependent protease
MLMNSIVLGIGWYGTFLLSLTFHEAAHAFAASKLGDRTAYLHGQVTLDPLPHIRRELFGMVIVPIISFLLSGWMIGWASTPYDPQWAQNFRRKAALMSLAGPAANLILVLAAVFAIRIGIFTGWFQIPDAITFNHIVAAASPGLKNALAILVSILFSLNLILLVFNLIPLPPLDGSNVFLLFLNDRTAERYQNFLRQPTNRLIGLVVAWQVFGPLFGYIHSFAINILYPGFSYH